MCMNIIVDSTIRIKNPSAELMAWCKENLVVPNPDYAKKLKMGFWTGKTPDKVQFYEVQGTTLVLPFGLLRKLCGMIDFSAAQSGFQPIRRVDYGEPVPLYDYQQRAVSEALEGGYGIIQSPAGSGKTQMGIALTKELGRTTLWLTTTKDLLKQSMERAERYMDKRLIGTITGGKVKLGEGITFATIQTMSKLNLDEYKHCWDCIIVDECHHVAGTANSATMFYRVLNSLSARHKYGLSATVHRADGMIKATFALVGDIICTVPKEAVADRILPVGITQVQTPMEMPAEFIDCEKLDYSRFINALCENENRNRVILNAIVENRDYSCLILSDRLAHLEGLMMALPSDMATKAVMISGKMTTKKEKAIRDKAIEQMRSGEKKYLFASYNLAKEGLDIPRLERLFLATPQKDYAVVVQSVGRIARTFDGKADPVAYDFVDGNIGMMIGMARKRARIYSENNCYFMEEGDEHDGEGVGGTAENVPWCQQE